MGLSFLFIFVVVAFIMDAGWFFIAWKCFPMRILIIDRDRMMTQMILSRLEAKGHEVVTEVVKNDGLALLEKENFDIVVIDPSPMKDARALALNIRRASKSYPYILLISTDEEIELSAVMKMGCNDFILKPIDPVDVEKKIEEAERLKILIDRLGDASEDFPSAGGVIAKSAFNQLFLSAIDRGGRYNEQAFVLAVSVENYKDVKAVEGTYIADYSVSKLAYHMVRLRRQSDIIGQTGVNEYSILLQRTENIQEAVSAANRFAVTLDEIDDFLPMEGNEIKLQIRVTLTDLPTGACSFDHVLEKTNIL